MLGPPGTVEGFDTFWAAAAAVDPALATPDRYAHHSLGDPGLLCALMSTCGWEVSTIIPITSVRECDGAELWRWLWGSLPLLRSDGAFVHGDDRADLERLVKRRFFADAQRLRVGDHYCIRSLAHMVVASAADPGPNCPGGPR